MGNRVGQEQQNVIQQGQVAGPQQTEPAPQAQVQQAQGMMVSPNGMAGPTASEQAYDAAQAQQAPGAGGVSAVAQAAAAAATHAANDPNAPGAKTVPSQTDVLVMQ